MARRPAARPRPWLAIGFAAVGFLAVVVAGSRPSRPTTRLPGQFRLADLISSEQRSAARLRTEVAHLRAEVQSETAANSRRAGSQPSRQQAVSRTNQVAGLQAVRGPALRVTLDDSSLDTPPEGGNVNDLVIHSQDVQAVVNALWRAGAEAMSINGQRLVTTSAVLCVGNTLLLNGTVHSPPYAVTAIGARRDVFDEDRLVKQLHDDAETFSLGFSVERLTSAEVPAYGGSTTLGYARPA